MRDCFLCTNLNASHSFFSHSSSTIAAHLAGILAKSENRTTTLSCAKLCFDHSKRCTIHVDFFPRIQSCPHFFVIALHLKLCRSMYTVLAAIIGSLQSVHQTIPRAVLISQLNMVCCFEHHALLRGVCTEYFVSCRKKAHLKLMTAFRATNGRAPTARLSLSCCMAATRFIDMIPILEIRQF